MNQLGVDTSVSVAPAIKRKPRLGFVGIGWIGQHRMKKVVESGMAEICSLVDPQLDMIRSAKEIAPGAEVVSSLENVLTSGLDGVVIASPSAMHAEQAIAALNRGIAVFCQKPLGIDAQQTQRAVEAARASDTLLKVDLCYRFVDGAQKIRELIANGDLGEIFSMELVFHNAYGPDKEWFYDPIRSGGGCLIDLGIHLIDLALWLLDFPAVEDVRANLFARGRRFRGRAFEVEDFAQATLQLGNGATAQIGCSWNAHAGQDAVIEAVVFGTKGGARLRNVNGSFYDFIAEHYTGTSRATLSIPPDEWGGRAVVDWVSQLCCGSRFDPSAKQLDLVAQIIDRIYAQ
jgi:predicted dehydrogenase